MRTILIFNKEILIINKLIENGTDSIDVGVYRGVHSYEMAKYSKNVHSFEPNPIIFKELKKYLPRIIKNINLYLGWSYSNTNLKSLRRPTVVNH